MLTSEIETFPVGQKGHFAMLLDLCRRLAEDRTQLKLENRALRAQVLEWNWPAR